MKKINLEEILLNTATKAFEDNDIHSSFNEGEINIILDAMREGIKLTLELAAENASLNIPTNDWQRRWVEKKSIINTINQVI